MSMEDLPKEIQDLIRQKMEENPELVEQYGDPFDKTDPRYWRPSTRAEKGVSPEDRLKFAELDVESLSLTFGRALASIAELQATVDKLEERELKRRIEEAKSDPAKAEELMDELIQRLGDMPAGSHGPGGEEGPAYAGSTVGIAPDKMVHTPNGQIRADQIPGYRNDPEWRPSPDWVQANCICPAHVAEREAAAQANPFGIDLGNDDQPPNGMYL